MYEVRKTFSWSAPKKPEKPKSKFDIHGDVCESSRRLLNRALAEGIFTNVDMYYEDRHNGRTTVVFVFTPYNESEV